MLTGRRPILRSRRSGGPCCSGISSRMGDGKLAAHFAALLVLPTDCCA